jgi:hypothetical protein
MLLKKLRQIIHVESKKLCVPPTMARRNIIVIAYLCNISIKYQDLMEKLEIRDSSIKLDTHNRFRVIDKSTLSIQDILGDLKYDTFWIDHKGKGHGPCHTPVDI